MSIDVNGHVWVTDKRRTQRSRDVLCLQCANCGNRTQVPMRSNNKESYLLKQKPCVPVTTKKP